MRARHTHPSPLFVGSRHTPMVRAIGEGCNECRGFSPRQLRRTVTGDHELSPVVDPLRLSAGRAPVATVDSGVLSHAPAVPRTVPQPRQRGPAKRGHRRARLEALRVGLGRDPQRAQTPSMGSISNHFESRVEPPTFEVGHTTRGAPVRRRQLPASHGQDRHLQLPPPVPTAPPPESDAPRNPREGGCFSPISATN